MDKKVWAIVAIIALHLSLMWFLRGSLKPEELARAAHPPQRDASSVEPNPYLAPAVLVPERAAVEETNPATPDDLALVSRRKRTSSHSRKDVSTARAEKPSKEKESSAFFDRTVAFTPPVFNDTIIVVKHAEFRPPYQAPQVKLVEPRAVPVADIRPIEKRKSFFKRAGAVVRKPYDWVRTLVSKL